MGNYLEMKMRKLEDLKNKRMTEQDEKLKQEFDVISCQSKKSFSRISKKSIKDIRAEQRSISREKSQAVLQSMQPTFEPSINSPSVLYQKKGRLLGLIDKEWTDKSHLERLAEDLEKRKQNLDKKMEE